jgi:Multidrug resistance efflux pump
MSGQLREQPGAEAPADGANMKQNGNGGRRRMLLGLLGFFLACGAFWAGYWHFFLAGVETTDNAYVAGNLVRISSRVAGNVAVLAADNHHTVAEGQVLLRLDDADARLALEKSKAALAEAVRQTASLMAEAVRLDAVISLREAELARAVGDLKRRRNQRTAMAVSEENLRHAEDDHAAALVRLREAREARAVNRALLRETALENQPSVVLAVNAVREAWLALERCTVKSPVSGIVARRAAQVGMRVSPETPLMAVVPLEGVWIDANFKEVQLAGMRIGQKATVKTDMYGGSVTYSGTVAGLSAGTGSSFSLLPPENATGNWIKVVQRVPVKIVLDAPQLAEHPLLVGLSCHVTVDVSDGSGPLLRTAETPGPIFETKALAHDMTAINEEIALIIAANSRNGQNGDMAHR